MVKGRDLISLLRHLTDATMVPGLSLQIDVAGPFMVKTKSKQAIQTRQEKREKRSTTKMWILLAIDYFTSKLEVSPLEDMTTGSISAAIQDIIIANGWSTRRLSLDPGSSLVTAVQDTSEAVADLQDEEKDHDEETVDNHQARALIDGLKREGFTIRIPFTKASFRQSKVESIIKSFKVCFKAAQLPGASPLSIVTFVTTIRRCAALLNSRPIAIIPPSLADPDEILSISPSSLTGPASSSWWSLGRSRNYGGQQALIQAHLKRFQSKWKTFYTNRLYSNSHMATRSNLEIGDVVLITDLSSNSTRSVHPALGRITGFLDPDSKSQAIVQYSNGKVDRPVSKLVVVVKASELPVNEKGKLFCPLAETDEQVQEDVEEQGEESYVHGDLEAASIPDEGHTDPPVLPLRPDDLPPQPENSPPPGEVVEKEEKEMEEEKEKERGDMVQDTPTVRQGPDNLTGQETQSSRPKRQRKPRDKF